MAWIWLVIAGVLETVWAVSMKYTDGFTRFRPTLFTLVAMAGSVWLLSIAVRTLPLGTAYAVWTGIGAAGAAILGMLLFDEPKTVARLLCLSLILAGIVGLKLAEK